MQNIHKLQYQLSTVEKMIGSIDQYYYSYAIPEMGNASVGQHVRHTLEIIQELITGYQFGRVDYANRKRDLSIETIPNYARTICEQLIQQCTLPNRSIVLIEKESDEEIEEIPSSYSREIHFVLDHTIHHMALIKTGLRILNEDTTNDAFGMAYSTLKHRKKVCVQ